VTAQVGDQEVLIFGSGDEARPLSSDALFLTASVDKNEKEKLLYDYAYIMKQPVRERLQQEFNVNLSELSIPEQFQFLMFLKEKEMKTAEPVQAFAQQYGTSALRTFLSLEQGGKEMGDKILMLGEKLPKESAELLFAKYGEIVDEVDHVVEFLSATLKEEVSPEIVNDAREHLLIKGKDLLAHYAKNAEICATQECVDLGRELENRLKDLKTSVVLLASATKALVAHGEFNFKDLKDIDISYDEHGLDEQDRTTVRAMSEENTKQYPEKLRDYWRGTLAAATENPAQGETFISVKYQNEIVAVMRVKSREDGSVYGASFNVNPSVRGSRIGTELLREVIENYAQEKDFHADVYDKNPMLDTYISKFGFEIIGRTENYHDTGTTVLQIVKRTPSQA